MLSTDDALVLVQGLVDALKPCVVVTNGWQLASKFSITARRSPAEAIRVDCRALTFHLGVTLDRDDARRLHELLDVLAWLVVCPGCSVTENRTLWARIVELLVGKDRIHHACLDFGDPTTFPRWIIPFDFRDGIEAFSIRPLTHDRDRMFIQELFARPPISAEEASTDYVAAMDRLRPLVGLAGRQPRDIPIGLDLNCYSATRCVRYYEDIRAFVRDLRALSRGNRIRFDSLGVNMINQVDIDMLYETSELDMLFRENSDLWFPRVWTIPAALESVVDEPINERANQLIRAVRGVYGNMLDHCLRHKPSGSQPQRIVLEYAGGTWQPSFLCAALRSSTSLIDHVILRRWSGQWDWIFFGLFHRSSRARVRLVELRLSFSRWELFGAEEVLVSDRPGKILIGNRLISDHYSMFEFPLIGTRARLRSKEFTMQMGSFLRNATPCSFTVFVDGEPDFDVLATSREWVGILVPGQGFGWVRQTAVDRIWKEESDAFPPTHSVQDLIIDTIFDVEDSRRLLRGIGSSLRSLALRGSETNISEDQLDEILHSCSNLTALELPSIRLNPLVQAYQDFRCAVTSLVIRNGFKDDSQDIARFLEMLTDKTHPGYTTLRELGFDVVLSWYNTQVSLTNEVISEIVSNSSNLQKFLLFKHSPYDDRIGSASATTSWRTPHPLISLFSVSGPTGHAIRQLNRDVWMTIMEFAGPHIKFQAIPPPALQN